MTTKTTILLSPIRRSSPKLKKRRITSIFPNRKSPIIRREKVNLPDLINDLYIEHRQQRQETILTIARILRKVGDQMDEQLQVNDRSSDHFFGQRTLTLIHCLSHVLRFFL